MRKSPVDQDGSGAEMSVSIRFLDDTQPLTIKYDKTTTGQQLFDRVSTHLQLLERGYFGLRYDADDGERYWLDALRTVHKQMKSKSNQQGSNHVCFLRNKQADYVRKHGVKTGSNSNFAVWKIAVFRRIFAETQLIRMA